MNARISRKFNFNAAIYFDECFIINNYYFEITMFVHTEDIREQNVALDRIKFLLAECLENCVFVHQKDIKIIDLYSKAGLKVCLLPEEPYDQVIGAVLLSKLNAICEDRLHIVEIKIQSLICDDVAFYIGYEDNLEFINSKDVWYTDNSPSTFEQTKKVKKEKIVQLKKEALDWQSLGLNWKDKIVCKENGEIVRLPLDK
jgi:hypothetical protein